MSEELRIYIAMVVCLASAGGSLGFAITTYRMMLKESEEEGALRMRMLDTIEELLGEVRRRRRKEEEWTE